MRSLRVLVVVRGFVGQGGQARPAGAEERLPFLSVDLEARRTMLPPVKVTAAEAEALRAFAAAHQLSMADLIREALKAHTGLDVGRRLNRARPRGYRLGPDLRRRW